MAGAVLGTHRAGLKPTPAVAALPASSRADLDALRGAAALMVAVFHALMWLRIDGDEALLMAAAWNVDTVQGATVRCLLALFNGATAVDVFFVLSGFVLAGSPSAQSVRPRALLAFSARRVLRLWPAYAASLVLAGVYLTALRGDFREWPQAASWLRQFYRDGAPVAAWLPNLTLLRVDLNPVAWSLRVEVVMSACLPFLLLSARHLGGVVALAQIAAAFAVAAFLRYDAIGHFLPVILLGLYGRVFQRALMGTARRWLPGNRLALLSVAALLVPGFLTLEHHPLADLSIGTGALGLILWLCQKPPGPAAAVPSHGRALLAFYGTLSYSFYLCHFIVLYAVAWALAATLPQALMATWPLPVMGGALVASLAGATALAHAMHHAVERPWMRIGRRLAGRLTAGGLAAPQACGGSASISSAASKRGPLSSKAQKASYKLHDDTAADRR